MRQGFAAIAFWQRFWQAAFDIAHRANQHCIGGFFSTHKAPFAIQRDVFFHDLAR